jgi:nucleotide-binding universal stress UspA family protein
MNKTILLAVDAARHVQAAVEMTRELSRDTGDKVIVLHVHEIAVGRFGRIRVDCAEGEGEQLVESIVAGLHAAGINAESEIRDADFGHLSRKILAVADEHDARIIVLGSRGRTDMPHLPLGSVSHRLLHAAHRPVLIVPRPAAVERVPTADAIATAGATG